MIKKSAHVAFLDSNSALSADLAPMLDILFMLLVFFILTTGVSFRTLELSLPRGNATHLTPDNKQIVIEVSETTYTLDGTSLPTITALEQELIKAISKNPELSVVVAGEKNASIQRLISLLTMLQRKEVMTANILMQEEK